MLKRTEKSAFSIPSCKVSKELFKLLCESLKGTSPHFFLSSETSDIETDDPELFLGTDWPSDISLIRISTTDQEHKIDILMQFKKKDKIINKVTISGSDPIWVNGIAEQLKSAFEKHRNWYSPITQHRKLRLLLSTAIVFLFSWQINRLLWRALVQLVAGIAEWTSFCITFFVLVWLTIPLDRTLLWIFPNFEFEHSNQKIIRGAFWFLMVLLVSWAITEFMLPRLMI